MLGRLGQWSASTDQTTVEVQYHLPEWRRSPISTLIISEPNTRTSESDVHSHHLRTEHTYGGVRCPLSSSQNRTHVRRSPMSTLIISEPNTRTSESDVHSHHLRTEHAYGGVRCPLSSSQNRTHARRSPMSTLIISEPNTRTSTYQM